MFFFPPVHFLRRSAGFGWDRLNFLFPLPCWGGKWMSSCVVISYWLGLIHDKKNMAKLTQLVFHKDATHFHIGTYGLCLFVCFHLGLFGVFLRTVFKKNGSVQVWGSIRSQACFYCSHRSLETCFHKQASQEGCWVYQIPIRIERAFQELTKKTVVQKERRELTASVAPTAAGYNSNSSISRTKISLHCL